MVMKAGRYFLRVVIVVINPTLQYVHTVFPATTYFFGGDVLASLLLDSRTVVTYVDPLKDLTCDRFLVTVLEKLISSERIFYKNMTPTRGSDVRNPAPT